MNSFVVEDDALIQIYIEYVMNNSEQTSKLFSLNKAETKLKFHRLQPIKNYMISSSLEENYKMADVLFRQFQYFTELLSHHDYSLSYNISEIFIYQSKNNANNANTIPLIILGSSLITPNTAASGSSVDFQHCIGQYGNLFLSLINEKNSMPLNKSMQRQILEQIKCTPLYFAIQRCIHPNKKERKVLMI